MKILYIGNVGTAESMSFYLSAVMAAKENHLDFHIAFNCLDKSDTNILQLENNLNITFHQIDFERNPLSFKNIKAYKQLIKLIRYDQYDIIHCNTPIGGFLGRLAGKRCKLKKIIYQAHGFHFYKGVPLLNWILYYPIERWLAHYTDALITINQEDYERAKKFHLRNNGKVYYIAGVGIDLENFIGEKSNKRDSLVEFGISNNDIVLISVGDLITRKNYPTAIKAVAKADDSRIHYLICGEGPNESALKKLTNELGVEKQIHFLGFRTDINDLLKASDIYLFTTLQEGLPRSLMEAMANGLPCIASKIRGNVDLLSGGLEIALVEPHDVNGFAELINYIKDNDMIKTEMSTYNYEMIKKFSMESVVNILSSLYDQIIKL